MSIWTWIRILAVALALAACSTKPYPPAQKTAVPWTPPEGEAAPPTTPAAPPTATFAAPAPSGSTVGTYPYGSPQPGGAAESAAPLPVTPAPRAEARAPEPFISSGDVGGGPAFAKGQDEVGGEPVTVITPDGGDSATPDSFASAWTKSEITAEQHRADIEACYRYAWAQVQHDMRIEDDVAAAFDDPDQGRGYTDLTRRMNLYDHKKRRTVLINDCMESKGYLRG